MDSKKNTAYFKWGLTAFLVIFAGILLVVIFTNLPGFFNVIHAAFNILSPLLNGVVIAFLLNPLVRLMDRLLLPRFTKKMKNPIKAQRLSRALSLMFAVIVAALIVFALVVLIIPQIGESIAKIVENAPSYYASVESWVTRFLEGNPELRYYAEIALNKISDFFNDWVNNSLPEEAQNIIATLSSSVFGFFKGIINLFIGVIAALYILASKDKFLAQSKKMIVAIFKTKTADRIMEVGREINRIFNGFVIGKLIDSAIIGVICYIGVLIMKMPFPVLIATLVGVTNIIPFFGPLIGIIPSTLLILMVNPMQALYFLIFVLILQQVDGNIIGPRILGDSIGISGFWVLVSITVFGGLFGFAGMVLGVPVFAVIYLLVSDAINAALRRKSKPVTSEKYYAIKTIDELDKNETVPSAEEPQQEQEPADEQKL